MEESREGVRLVRNWGESLWDELAEVQGTSAFMGWSFFFLELFEIQFGTGIPVYYLNNN